VAEGSDADVIIFDPSVKHTISAKAHHSAMDTNIYEGYAVTGKVRGRRNVSGDVQVSRVDMSVWSPAIYLKRSGRRLCGVLLCLDSFPAGCVEAAPMVH